MKNPTNSMGNAHKSTTWGIALRSWAIALCNRSEHQGDYIRGILGTFQGGVTVEFNVALNSQISVRNADGIIGRVVGRHTGGTLANNYARDAGMTLTAGVGTRTPEPNLNGKDGANAVAADTHGANAETWWSSAPHSWLFAHWTFATDRLPHLRTTHGTAFADTQNPEVK